jgi:hypothetical protein
VVGGEVTIPSGWRLRAPASRQERVRLWTTDDACWLSGIGGGLDKLNWAALFDYSGRTDLVVNSDGRSSLPVIGRAMCASLGTGLGFKKAGAGYFSWWQGQPWTRMTSTQNSVCMLTNVGGRFRGYGEQVFIYPQDGYWYLGGYSAQEGVRASGRCYELGSRTTTPANPTLTVRLATDPSCGPASGTVTSLPAGISCTGGTCSASFAVGDAGHAVGPTGGHRVVQHALGHGDGARPRRGGASAREAMEAVWKRAGGGIWIVEVTTDSTQASSPRRSKRRGAS